MTMSTSEAALDEMIREFFRAWERRDTDHIASCFTDDAVYHNIPMEPIVGKTAIRQFLSQRANEPPPHIEIHHQVVSGGIVMNERTDHMTVDGRRFALPICGVFEIHDGLMKAWREYFDSAPVTDGSTEEVTGQ